MEPEENSVLYYTLTSVTSGVPGGEVRESLLTFASQFIGNPYVWGDASHQKLKKYIGKLEKGR